MSDKLKNLDERKEELIKRIELAEKGKKKVIGISQGLLVQYKKRKISTDEYGEKLKEVLNGRNIQEWFDYYDDYIVSCNKYLDSCRRDIRKERGKLSVRKTVPFLIIFGVLILLILLFTFFISIQIPVFLAPPVEFYTQDLNLKLSTSTDYEWQPDNAGTLDSVKISGLIEGDGEVKIYLMDSDGMSLLILDSSNLEITSSGTKAITGAVIGENNETNKTNLTEPEFQSQLKEESIVIKEFTNICEETCDLSGLGLDKGSYVLRIEIIGDAELNLNSITYGLLRVPPVEIPLEVIPEVTKVEQEIPKGKRVIVTGPPAGLENVPISIEIPEIIKVGKEKRIKVYWREQNKFIDFEVTDLDGNGFLDSVSWIIPSLGSEEQTFDIILITGAEHLDSNRMFISDIFKEVRELDNIWSETIPSEDYVRVTFERPLTNENDITIFPRTVSGNPRIEVYEVDGKEIIAEFTSINDNEYNKVLLTNLVGSQDVFDLRILDGSIEIDHIVDPLGGTILINGCDLTDITTVLNEENAVYQLIDDVNFDVALLFICFEVTAKNITLDGQGHSVVRTDIFKLGDTFDGLGIDLNSQNFTLKNINFLNGPGGNIDPGIDGAGIVKVGSPLIIINSTLEELVDIHNIGGFAAGGDISVINSTVGSIDAWGNFCDPQQIGCPSEVITQNEVIIINSNVTERILTYGGFAGPGGNITMISDFIYMDNLTINATGFFTTDFGGADQPPGTLTINYSEGFTDINASYSEKINLRIVNRSEGDIFWYSPNNTAAIDSSSLTNLSIHTEIHHNFAFVNGTALLALNKETFITFNGFPALGLTDPIILRNGVACVDCHLFTDLFPETETVKFNVSGFDDFGIGTNYTIGEESVAFPCQVLDIPDTVYTLASDITTTGTCFTVTAENIVLDGAGFFVRGDGTGFGVDAQGVAGLNFAVRNINITNFATSVSSAGTTTNRDGGEMTIINSGLDSVNASGANTPFAGGGGGNINIFESNVTIINSIGGKCTGFFCIAGDLGSSTQKPGGNVIFENTDINLSNGFIDLVGGGGVSDKSGRLTLNYSRSFEDLNSDYGNSIKLTLINSSFNGVPIAGEIKWLPELVSSTLSSLSTYTEISHNLAFVDSTALTGLNKTASITLFGSPGAGFTNPEIKRDGASCGSICANFTALDAVTVVFNVSYWTNYSIGESVNTPPVIVDISFISDFDDFLVLNEGSVTYVNFSVLANDLDGFDTFSLNATFSKFGEDTRTNSSCVVAPSCNDPECGDTLQNYSCTIDMWYWDGPGWWNVSATALDNGGLQSAYYNESFFVAALTTYQISPILQWDPLSPGDINQPALEGIQINNTGNIPWNNLEITAYNLLGVSDNSYSIPAANFWIDIIPNSCSPPATQLHHDLPPEPLTNFPVLEPGNNSAGQGQDEIFFCLAQVPSPLLAQEYSTTVPGGSAWEIILSVTPIVVGKALRRKRKKKKKNQKELIKALSDEDLLEILGEKLVEFLDVVKGNKFKIKEEEEQSGIPVSIFREDMSPAEALCKYLKENKGMKFNEIAKVINRDQRTLWTNYNNAIKKKKDKIVIGKEKIISIPIKVFWDRRFSILESIVKYLKEKGIRNSEIANMLGKDQKNIWTLYSRAKKKLGIKTKS